VSDQLPTRAFTDQQIEKLASLHPTNYWIPSSSISSASIHRGVTTSKLRMKLADGRQITLLWLRNDPAEAELRSVLPAWGVDL
jgi:hypothetical protein